MLAFTADFLTLSRLIAAILLLWLGTLGETTLWIAVAVTVLAWTSDQLDGLAARHTNTPTRLAPYDFAIDTALYGAILGYLVLAGFLPLVPVLIFVTLALIACLGTRRKAALILTVRLIDLMLLWVIFAYNWRMGCLLVLWLLALGLIYRRRLQDRVPRWFAEIARLLGLRGRA